MKNVLETPIQLQYPSSSAGTKWDRLQSLYVSKHDLSGRGPSNLDFRCLKTDWHGGNEYMYMYK